MKVIIIAISILLLFSNVFMSNSENDAARTINELKTKGNFETGKKDLKTLDQLAWENRIILVKEKADSALSDLRKNKKQIDERHIIWFRLTKEELKTNYRGKLHRDFISLLKQNYFDKYEIKAYLIGKDGGVKSKDDTFDLQNYFRQIDSMPMRKQEMR